MTHAINPQRYYDQTCFRVWPDGTIQDVEETPHSHMSDDYCHVWAYSEDEALKIAYGGGNGQDPRR